MEEKIALSKGAVKSLIRRHKEQEPEQEYVALFDVLPTWIDPNVDYSEIFGKKARVFYHADLRKLILKILANIHEIGTMQFCQSLFLLNFNMGLKNNLRSYRAATVQDGPYSKEPDDSWHPVTLPAGRDPKWPGVILETRYAESLLRLRIDASWWLCSSKG